MTDTQTRDVIESLGAEKARRERTEGCRKSDTVLPTFGHSCSNSRYVHSTNVVRFS